MEPGRALDALVAEKVMGWIRITKPHEITGAGGEPAGMRPIGGGYVEFATVPHYTTDIAAAWQVFTCQRFENVYKGIAHVRRRSLGWTLGQPMEWQCTIYATNTQTSDTAPHAICLAALKAAGVEVD